MLRRWLMGWLPVGMFFAALAAGWVMARGSRLILSASEAAGWPSTPGVIAPVFTREVRVWRTDLARWAEQAGLAPNLAATVMQIESCGWPGALSPAGARGLFQVMPFHFAAEDDMLNPDTNASRGLAYLAESVRLAHGDVGRALAGYNGGHGLVDWPAEQWPAETRRYVYWGSGIYAEAESGWAVSTRLTEWLEAGGASLCAQASLALGLVP